MWSGAAAASEGASSDSPLSVAALALDEALLAILAELGGEDDQPAIEDREE